MAATGYTPISLYYSTTASATPSAGNLVAGELALNTTDEKLYFKNAAGTVKLLASNAATTPVSPGGSDTQVQYNSSGSFAGSASLTFDGTTFTAPNSVITSSSSSNALRITQTGTGNALLVEDSASTDSTPLVIDASGRLVVGNTASVGNNEQFQVDNANAGMYRASTSDYSALYVYRTRGTLASPTAVSANDILGAYGFGAYTSGGWQGGPNSVTSYIYATHSGETSYGGSSAPISIKTWSAAERDYDWTFSSSTNGSAVLTTSGGSYNTGIITLGNGSLLWKDTYSSVEVSNTGSFYGTTATVDVANNVYYNASNAFIYKTTAAATRYEQTVGTHAWYTAPSGTAGATATFTQAMTLNASGNLGVGTSSPSYRLQANFTEPATTSRNGFFMNTSATNSDVALFRTGPTHSYAGVGASQWWLYHYNSLAIGSDSASAVITFVTNAAERARISAAGGFSVGTTADPGVGAIYATGNITAYYSSDIKFKENVRDIPDALATVNAIGGKLFDWTDEYIESKGGADGYFVQKADFGVVAQDVQKVFPIAVRTREDGSLAVDYEKLSALAMAALTELTKRVEALETN